MDGGKETKVLWHPLFRIPFPLNVNASTDDDEEEDDDDDGSSRATATTGTDDDAIVIRILLMLDTIEPGGTFFFNIYMVKKIDEVVVLLKCNFEILSLSSSSSEAIAQSSTCEVTMVSPFLVCLENKQWSLVDLLYPSDFKKSLRYLYHALAAVGDP